jgi:hypothetical protein
MDPAEVEEEQKAFQKHRESHRQPYRHAKAAAAAAAGSYAPREGLPQPTLPLNGQVYVPEVVARETKA